MVEPETQKGDSVFLSIKYLFNVSLFVIICLVELSCAVVYVPHASCHWLCVLVFTFWRNSVRSYTQHW